MGHTLDEWRAKVAELVRDPAGRDLSMTAIDEVGLRPAISQFSDDRPRQVVRESAGSGSRYFDLPEGWVVDFSTLSAVEYPALQDPPTFLDSTAWRFIQDVVDPDIQKILLSVTPAVSEKVRFSFTVPWPFPSSSDATEDKISDLAFEAVSALAAAYCCDGLAAQSARNRSASLPTNYVGGNLHVDKLQAAADRYRRSYDRFVGRFASDDPQSVEVGSIRLAIP